MTLRKSTNNWVKWNVADENNRKKQLFYMYQIIIQVILHATFVLNIWPLLFICPGSTDTLPIVVLNNCAALDIISSSLFPAHRDISKVDLETQFYELFSYFYMYSFVAS